MLKVPWRSTVVCYREHGECFEAERALDYILVREVAPHVGVKGMADLLRANEAFETKLMACPFLVLGDATSVSASAVGHWDESEHPVLPAELSAEDSVVYLNLHAPITHYKDGGAFCQGDSVFCKTMPLPRHMDPNHIHKLMAARARYVAQQLESSRILLGEESSVACYSGSDFTLLKQIRR